MNLDIELFVEQTGWLGPRLRDPSRLGVVTWLGRRLEGDSRKALLRSFPLLHPIQKQAEYAVCQLLSRAIVVHADRFRRTATVVRSVDWAATYANTQSGERPPAPYLSRVRHSIPDRSCLSALASIAHSWRCALELFAGSEELDSSTRRHVELRREQLERAVPPQLSRGLVPVAFGQRHAQRLRALDEGASAQVKCVMEALGFWNNLFGVRGDGSDTDSLVALARTLQGIEAENVDTLMEATIALSIARAASQSDKPDWPTTQPWTIVRVDDGVSKYPVIQLKSGELMCEIGKGTPLETRADGSRRRIADLLSAWADEALPATGKARSTGRQPDLVVTFWLDSDPTNTLFALADAKRNATRDGQAYLRDALEVAATYLMSFGYRMGLQVPGLEGGRIATVLTPGVTLFCRQGTGRDAASAIDLLRRDDDAPVVMAFDLEQHFSAASRPWHAPVLAAWLGSLGRQAAKILTRSSRHARRVGGRYRQDGQSRGARTPAD